MRLRAITDRGSWRQPPQADFPPCTAIANFPTRVGLMSYGANLASHCRQAADYVNKTLRGGNPGDIPVAQPTKFDLIVNLKAAKALDLELSPSLLAVPTK